MMKRLTAALLAPALVCLSAAWSAASAGSARAAATLFGAGDVDPSFDPGAITTQFGPTFINAVAVQPDGRILVGGGFGINAIPSTRMIARLNPDGSLDPTFNLVPSQSHDTVSSIVVEPDGNILIGGRFYIIGNTQTNGLARLNPNGTLNAGLGAAATFGTSLAGILDVKAIALQTDGRIVAGGEFLTPNVPAVRNLARLEPTGTLDFGFGNPQTDAPVDTVAVQPDGKILVGGLFANVNGATRPRIARLNPDGSVEAAFLPALLGGEVVSLLPQTDGKILVGGSLTSVGGVARRHLARLNADGSLDPF